MKARILILSILLIPLSSFARPNDGNLNRALSNRDIFEIEKGRPSLIPGPAEMKRIGAKSTQIGNRITFEYSPQKSVFIDFDKDTKIEDQVWRLTEGSIDQTPQGKNVQASTTTLYQDGIRSKTKCLSFDTAGSKGTSLDCITATSRLCKSIKDNLKKQNINPTGVKKIQELSGQCQQLSQLVTELYPDPQFGNQYDQVVREDITALEAQLKQTSLKKQNPSLKHSLLESLGFSSDLKINARKADDLAKNKSQLPKANLDLALMAELIATCNDTQFGDLRAYVPNPTSGSGATGRQ